MILAPNCNNQICAICSAGFNASLQLPINHNRVQFCMSYHLHGHCNNTCMHKGWRMPLTATKIAQLNIFQGPYVATPAISWSTATWHMWCVRPGVDNDTRTSSFNKDCLPFLPPRPPKPKNSNIHCSGIPPLLTTPTKCTRAEIKDPAATAKKKAWATQQHLDCLGKLANMGKICLYKDHEGDLFDLHNSVMDSSAWWRPRIYVHSWDDHNWFFLLCCPGEHTVTLTMSPTRYQTYNSTKRTNQYPHSPLSFCIWWTFLPFLWHTKNWCKRQTHWPQMFHLHNTLSHLVVAHGVAHLNSHKANPHQSLCSYCHTASKIYHYLAYQDITQILHASALYHLHFCVNPSSTKREKFAIKKLKFFCFTQHW